MSSRLDFSPEQLDRLEDALEDLELGLAVEGDDPVGRRLVEFREILQLSREALPMEEVPGGLLDGVLAEARQAAVMTAPAVEESWWSRLRKSFWIPTLAFAGSAALLLVVLLPEGDSDDAAASKTVARADEAPARQQAGAPGALRLADADELAEEGRAKADDPFTADGAVRGEGVAIGERAPEPLAEPEPEAPAETDPAYAVAADGDEPEDTVQAERKRASASTGASTSKPMPMPKPKPQKAPTPAPAGNKSKGAPKSSGGSKKDAPAMGGGAPSAPVEDLQDVVADGHRLRRGGNCGLAKMRYEKARKLGDSRIRAQALAGLGLCKYAAGDEGTAKKLFAQAKASDPSVAGFIDAELSALDRAQAPAAAEQSKSNKKE